MYNGVLALPASEETMIINFANGLTVIVTAKYAKDVEVYVTETVGAVKYWLERARLAWLMRNWKTVEKRTL